MKNYKSFVISAAMLMVITMATDTVLADLNDGLVAYYPFSGDANDASGNGYHGAVVGADPCEDRCYTPESAYYFNGAGDYVDIDVVAPVFGPTDSFTVHALFNSSGGSGNDAILGYTVGGANAGQGWGGVFGILINTDGRLCAEFQDNNGNNSGPVFSPEGKNYNDGQWHAVGFTRDTITDTINLYIDGDVDSATDVTVADASINHLRIGCIYDEVMGAYWDGYKGVIDEVRIYNRALSASEIAELVVPCDPIEEILYFIDDSVDEGKLVPVKDGKPGQGQLGALINMIEAAGNLIDAELLTDACWQLQDALQKTDGLSPPESTPDFVAGEATAEVASMIEALMESLGCE